MQANVCRPCWTAAPTLFYFLWVLCPRFAAAQAPSSQPGAAAGALPPNSRFVVPGPPPCNSLYDRFYKREPGVYAYWGLCDVSVSSPSASGGLGVWSFAHSEAAAGSAPLESVAGPFPDQEAGTRSPNGAAHFSSQDFVLNKHAGTLAAFVSSGLQTQLAPLAGASGVTDRSGVRLQAVASKGALCLVANLSNSAGGATNVRRCGMQPGTWHRAVMTWQDGTLTLFYDGKLAGSTRYSGALGDTVYFAQLFPGYAVGAAVGLAKVAFSNQAWTSAEAAADFAPAFPAVPSGGVLVKAELLGEIHRDVLGYADINQDMSNAKYVATYKTALQTMGVSSVRYAGGFAGITADVGDWRNGAVQCGDGSNGAAKGTTTMPATNQRTANFLDHYMETIAEPLHLDVGYTVNYGTDPPQCKAGGDPVVNGADLVKHANVEKRDRIKYWEIGNEEWASGCCAIDNHPNPYLKDAKQLSTYPEHESAFFDAMKAVDPGIQIGVPMNGPDWFSGFVHFGLPCLLHCKYDAIVVHPYPVQPNANDGDVLYPERLGPGMVNVEGYLRQFQTILLNVSKPKENLWLTEWDGAPGGAVWNRQSMGAVAPLFVVQQLAAFMTLGVPYATYWAQGSESDYCKTFNYDAKHAGPNAAYNWVTGCGTFSLFRGLTPAVDGAQHVGLKPGDILPPGRGLQVLAQSGFVHEGEHMLRTYTDETNAPWLAAWGATHGASFAVILINRDRDAAHRVPVQLPAKWRETSAQQWTYGKEQYDASAHGDWSQPPVHKTVKAGVGITELTLPPWSVNVVVF